MSLPTRAITRRVFVAGLTAAAAGVGGISMLNRRKPVPVAPADRHILPYRFRDIKDTSGYVAATKIVPRWQPNVSLVDFATAWRKVGYRAVEDIDRDLARDTAVTPERIDSLLIKAMLLNYEADTDRASRILAELRTVLEEDDRLKTDWLDTVIYYQGVTDLRRGEVENCVHCRGRSACILPIVPSAVHSRPAGSRGAIEHFTEHLELFPDDLEVRWLLNVAHMTLGEHPGRVEPKYLISLDSYHANEFDIGRFEDVSEAAGVDRVNLSGGAVMDDFDNDGRLDLVVTSRDPTMGMAYYHNKGDGTFEERTANSGLDAQLGGFNCCQADYNNDGNLDLFVSRGAWLEYPLRPSLLKNNGDGKFIDATREAGLLDPVNSPCAVWADYDNDGFLDLFVCCERQPNRLYHNRGDGTFEEVAAKAGLKWDRRPAKGAAWIDYDNDGFPDLFICNSGGAPSQLYHNNGDGTFTDVSRQMGIHGPTLGFACWAWDYNNDGWLDLFATSYDRTLEDVVSGMLGRPNTRREKNRLYRNLEGKGFRDVTEEAGLDQVFAAMGCNYGDFDNDGFLDFYLGTGDPDLAMLVPNRMFKNVAGKRFAEITSSSGTGHLQKGHGVACGDLRRIGALDLFIQMGGAAPADAFHNLLFQNPGQRNRWLTVKLVGKKTNRSAIGARIKVTTAGKQPLVIHRHVSSGSSFGGNPLEQTIGLGEADRVAELEIRWPTSGTTQLFRNLEANQGIEIVEFASGFHRFYEPLAL